MLSKRSRPISPPNSPKRTKTSSKPLRKDTERFAVTLSEATVHAGGVDNKVTGKMAKEGFGVDELKAIAMAVKAAGGRAEIVEMTPPPAEWVVSGDSWTSTVPEHPGERFPTDLEACVLILRGGSDYLCGPGSADRLFAEQCSFGYDQLYLNGRQHKIMKKHARRNIEFGPIGKEQAFPSIIDPKTGQPLKTPQMPAQINDMTLGKYQQDMEHYKDVVTAHNYVDPQTNQPIKIPKKTSPEYAAFISKYGSEENCKYFKQIKPSDVTSTVKAFGDLPYLNQIHQALGQHLGSKADNLFAEGNHYFGPTSNINYHGDGERKKVICLCLGKETVLKYQWRGPIQNKAIHQVPAALVRARHGDIYIMSEKATGYDWKFGIKQWPEPRLVHGAAFNEQILEDFSNKKKQAFLKKQQKK